MCDSVPVYVFVCICACVREYCVHARTCVWLIHQAVLLHRDRVSNFCRTTGEPKSRNRYMPRSTASQPSAGQMSTYHDQALYMTTVHGLSQPSAAQDNCPWSVTAKRCTRTVHSLSQPSAAQDNCPWSVTAKRCTRELSMVCHSQAQYKTTVHGLSQPSAVQDNCPWFVTAKRCTRQLSMVCHSQALYKTQVSISHSQAVYKCPSITAKRCTRHKCP